VANTPAKNTAGSMSSSLRQRMAMVKTANPIADSTAAAFPANAPTARPSPSIITMPRPETPTAIFVALRTGSRRMIQPKMTAKKGAVGIVLS
jgi:hypothetical protein